MEGLDFDRVSELHCGLPAGSAGVCLLSMNHAGDPSDRYTATLTAEGKETEETAAVAKHEDKRL